jgi:CBS domain-containing protein
MPAEHKPTAVGDVVASARAADPAPSTLRWLARLLRSEGVNLVDATTCELGRGTPVWVDARADVVDVQRLMAVNHIRSLPVLEGGEFVGVLDLVDLALRDDLAEGNGPNAAAS